MNCTDCNTPLKPLFGAKWFCPNDCDRKTDDIKEEGLFIWDNERTPAIEEVGLNINTGRTFYKSNPKVPGFVRWEILPGNYNIHPFKHYVKITEKEGGNKSITLRKVIDWIPMWSTGGTRHIAPNSYTCFFPDDISCRQHFSSNPSEYVVQSGEYSQIVMRYPGMNRDMVVIQNTSKTKDLVVGKK